VRLVDPLGKRRSTTFPTEAQAEMFRSGTLALWAREGGPQRLQLALRLAAACLRACDAWEALAGKAVG
jgi:hypothetical protein